MQDLYVKKTEGPLHFSYHKQSGYIGFTYAILAVVIVETVGVSFLLYKWSPLIHWIHLLLSLACMIFLVVDLRAVLKNPICYDDGKLSLKIGIRPRVVVDIENIQELKNGSLNYENDRKNKDVLDLTLLGFDEPTWEIVLLQPIQTKNSSRPIARIFVSVDNKDKFYQMLYKKGE